MGFFSWNTADKEESIANVYSEKFNGRPVYMLQPNGLPPIEEKGYEGYGEFGGVNAYLWFYESNKESLSAKDEGLSEGEKISLGISMECGWVCVNVKTRAVWHVFHDARKLLDGEFFDGGFDAVIPAFNSSMNELVKSGEFLRVQISDFLKIRHPLKFSYNREAVYEDLPSSKTCEYQGFFY